MSAIRSKTIIEDIAEEYPQLQSRVRKINSDTMQKQKNPALPSRVEHQIQFSLPSLNLPMNTFKDFQRKVPRPPKILEKPKFPIFNRLFSFIYYLIGEEGKGIWNQFGQLYNSLLPNQSTSIVNRSTYDNTENLTQFMKSGMQVKLLVQVQDSKIATLIPILKSKDIIQAHVQSERDVVRLPNVKLVTSMSRIFQKQVKSQVKKSCKQQVYFNFINIQSKFPQLFKRKNLIQKCLEPKNLDQYVQNHKKFMKMMETYQNKRYIKQIEKEHSNIASFLFTQKIKGLRSKIQVIQKEQGKFCQYFLEKIKEMHPIQDHEDKQKIFLQIIKQYKQQHSIYEVLNNNIRLSICINENIIKYISPLIKYMYESIRYFFFKQLHTLRISEVYRGALLPLEEINQLSQGRYLFNIGFMSTTKVKKVAQDFKKFYGEDNEMAYLFIIKIEDHYKDKQLCENQQGFFSISDQFKIQLMQQKHREEEVLFNPLNIFRIQKIDRQERVLYLQYAPHINLMKKMRQKTITPQQLKQYQNILPNILLMNKSNYDRGQALRQKGKVKLAMNYYKQVEQKGETLTIQQKINKINILAQSKNFTLVEKQINQMIKLEESAKQEEKNLLKAVRLTKQSENKQKLSDFVSAKKMADSALQNSQLLMIELQKKQKSSNKKISNEQILGSIIIKIKSRIQLSKSNFETNEYEKSIDEGWTAFNMIDYVYKIYEDNVLPQIQKLLSKQEIIQTDSTRNLIEVKKFKLKNNVTDQISLQQFNKIQMQSQKAIKNTKLAIKNQLNGNQTQNKLKESKMKKVELMLKEYFQKRKIKKYNYMKLYNASIQIQNYICNTSELKKLKILLQTHKTTIQSLMDLELNLFNLMTNNMRAININILPCMDNQKQDFFQQRFQQFIKANQKQVSTDHVKYRTRYYQFLLQYSDLQKQQSKIENIKKSQKLQLQSSALKQLQQLDKQVKQQAQKQKQAFTIQKSMIIEVETNYYKNCCLQSQIIQKAASYHITHKNQQSKLKLFHTIGSYRVKQNYQILKQKLNVLQKIHQADENINKFCYVLQDVNNLVAAMNESYEATDSYRNQLNEANKKLQQFMKIYLYQSSSENLRKSVNQKNEQLALLYYLSAQNKLRRGYYYEAQMELGKAQKLLTELYGQEQPSLHARQISIKCYRLQSQLVGMYGDYQKRGNCLVRLCKIKKYFEEKIYNPITLVLVNEAVAFIAVRCLPNEISLLAATQNAQIKIFQQAENALQRSITLRTQLLGNQNEFIVTAYSYIVSLLSKILISQKNQQKIQQKIQQHYDEGRKIFIELQKNEQQLKKDPILYIYKMKMYANYEKSKTKPSADLLTNIYCENVQKFFSNSKDIRGLFLAQQFFEAGKHLFQKNKNKQQLLLAEKLFIKSQQDLRVIIKLNVQGQKDLMFQLLSKICSQLQKFYRLNQNSEKYEFYKKKVKLIEKRQSILQMQMVNQPKKTNFLTFMSQYISKCLGSQKQQ